MSQKNFYITTTLPYVNSDPHIGFAMEIVRADMIARYKKWRGFDVFFNTGTDEHGVKIFQKAADEGKDVQTYVNEYAEKFRSLKELLGLSADIHFIRTTDKDHEAAAQEFWKLCDSHGYIYKKNYQVKYCVGCEMEKTESELDENGECPLHPGRKIELIDEENYFFKFSAFQEKLMALYAGNPEFIVPEGRYNEIRAFVERGLEDFSISRLASKMPWGIPVPGDETQVIYVWFDALVNYISTLGWGTSAKASATQGQEDLFQKFWVDGETVQIAGKDNLRQQSAMWQAMLMAAGLPPTNKILINGFVNVNGQKMSKSLGNVINPGDLVKEYGTEAVRVFLLKELGQFEDADMTLQRFKDAYNANLANGLGNLVSRLAKMSHMYFEGKVSNPDFEAFPRKSRVDYATEVEVIESGTLKDFLMDKAGQYTSALDAYDLTRATNHVWEIIGELDKYISDYEPFKMVKENKEMTERFLANCLSGLSVVSVLLTPIIPETAEKVRNILGIREGTPEEIIENTSFNIAALSEGLFPRRE